MQRRMIKTKLYYKHFYSISKEASHIYLKVFPKCVYHWHNLLRWLFFVLCENWTQYFLFYLKRSVFKIYKKSFPSVSIIDTTCFDECFLFYVITGHSIFLKKTNLSLPRGLVQPPFCCVHWSKCFERSPHFMIVISTIILQWY